MIRINVTPEQIQALNDGQEIVVLVRMEPQPKPVVDEHGVLRAMSVDYSSCPVAVGDTVEVVPELQISSLYYGAHCYKPNWNWSVRRGKNLLGSAWSNSEPEAMKAAKLFADGYYKRVALAATVQSIANHEVDGVHNWELRLNQ